MKKIVEKSTQNHIQGMVRSTPQNQLEIQKNQFKTDLKPCPPKPILFLLDHKSARATLGYGAILFALDRHGNIGPTTRTTPSTNRSKCN